MHEEKMNCCIPEWKDPCNCHDTPNFCPPPKPPFCPQPPVPSVVQGVSLYEAMQDLNNRVNICIDTYNHVMAENYRTLRNLEKQAEENGAYYGSCDVYVEEGYSAEESAAYKIIHKKVVDRRGEPIRLELHFAYNNTTNSKIEQTIDSASKIEFADKIVIAQPKTDKGWYGNVIWHGAPLPSDPEASLYSVGFTRSGQMKVYSNSVSADRMISDGIENSIGCSGVLVQNGEITDSAWYENIPNYNIQSSRVLLGQNFTTQEVMIFVTGKENDETKQGMTSLRCAQILKDYGCNLVVEVGEGLSAGAMDKGSLMFTPENKQMPNAYAFWYISRKCYYKNDYERELAELVQNYGACIWQGYLNKENILDLRNDLNTEIEERKNADSVLQDNIDKEQARAEEAERVLQENIDKEQARAEAAEDLLDKAIKAEQARAEERENEIEANLNTEIDRAKEAERVLQANLDKETAERKAEDSVLSERINAEQERAEAAETTLQANIEKEENRATEAERVLQANINKEQARAENAEQTLQTNIDKEVSRATTAEDLLDKAIKAEQARAEERENEIEANLNTEIDRAKEAERVLQANLDKETAERKAEDSVLSERINAEQERAEAAETTLQANIEKEENRATEAERVLQANINKEQARAENAEQTLQTNIDKEVSRATTAEDNLRDSLSAEATARINADNDLQSKIEQETTERKAADNVLQENITKEETARISAVNAVQSNLDEEIDNRKAADQELETRINGTITALTTRVTTLETNVKNLQDLTVTLQEQMTALDTTVSSLSNLISTIETALNNVKTDVNNIKIELAGIKDGSIDLPYIKRVDGTGTGTHHLENLIISGDETVDSLEVLTTCTVPEPTADSNAATKKYVDEKVYLLHNLNFCNTIKGWTFPTGFNTEYTILTTDYDPVKAKKAEIIKLSVPDSVGISFITLVKGYNSNFYGNGMFWNYGQNAYVNQTVELRFAVDNAAVLSFRHGNTCSEPPTKDYNLANKKYVDDNYLPLAGGTMATSETNPATITWDMSNVNKANRAPFINVDCSSWKDSETNYFSIKGTNLAGNEVELFMNKNDLYIQNNTRNYNMKMGAAGITLNRESSQNCFITATNNNLRIDGLITPALDNQAANKKYVDDKVNAFKNITVTSESPNNYNAVVEWDGSSNLTLPENVNFSTPILLVWLPLYDKNNEDVSTYVPIYASHPIPALPIDYYASTARVGISTGANIDVKIDYSNGSITLQPIK